MRDKPSEKVLAVIKKNQKHINLLQSFNLAWLREHKLFNKKGVCIWMKKK